MDLDNFKRLVHRLTGSPVKPLTEIETEFLAGALKDDESVLAHEQFNELLLVANKDRVQEGFFAFFFCRDAGCTTPTEGTHQHATKVAALSEGVERFQRYAMLRYGNFKYAYRELAGAQTRDVVRGKLLRFAADPAELEAQFGTRPKKVVAVDPIVREDTFLLGHISGRQVVADSGRAKAVRALLSGAQGTAAAPELTPVQPDEIQKQVEIRAALEKRAHREGRTPIEILDQDSVQLTQRLSELKRAQSIGTRNTAAYLTWEYMDLYFATSMRERWDYEELHGFVHELMHHPELAPLKLRYFDPTVSYEEDRIDKGLVEALMLKRSLCTVYSIQLSDTLGKDSELAATLAQGKPVIAYAPQHDSDERAKSIASQPLLLSGRCDLLWVDAPFREYLSEDELGKAHYERYQSAVDKYEDEWPWSSVENSVHRELVFGPVADSVLAISRAVAAAEERALAGRVSTLTEKHPLGIQVKLESGVANGVLVTRDLSTCARLVRSIVLNQLDFVVEDANPKLPEAEKTWKLREASTGSVYRVVTGNQKLTNCFWNFYRRPAES